ncbi:hypothetical protein HELRODRAFT_71648 [Helobdella robusta]|uniref:Methyltransferase small domain-containing protein n=1 Tax=Helobdella robusta TaxID=6412 RepID=T1G0P8_HELRO|nr:hypothetical protein HELRODRAFT_71648 [Helobdella robusta]ESO11538.1 hypothetical protein HELRODRAFT_71648 [Helobdella robusta]
MRSPTATATATSTTPKIKIKKEHEQQNGRRYFSEYSVESAKYQSALIIYSEENIPELHRLERNIIVGKYSVKIRQQWSALGVAGSVWDAAIVLAEYSQNDDLNGLNVIELGSGTGFLGIFYSKLGAKVTLTDVADCIPNMEHNVGINEASGAVTVKELKWGQNLSEFQDKYDFILGADIVYIEETFKDLLNTLLHLSNCQTKIFLSCKIRYKKDSKFISSLCDYFSVETVHYDDKYDITIYLARKIC